MWGGPKGAEDKKRTRESRREDQEEASPVKAGKKGRDEEREDSIVGYNEMDLTFIVIGATGAGKSTFINSLVHRKAAAMPSNSKASVWSQTKEVQRHTTPRYKLAIGKEDVGLKVTFFDTIGVDADDVNSKQVFTTLVRAVTSEKVNGFVLVHKMERFKKSLHEELKTYLRMLKELGISTNKILLVITHSGQYSDEVKKAYTEELCEVLTWFPDCAKRTMHANFVNFPEMHPDFHEFYLREWPVTFKQVMTKLAEYSDSFCPLSNIVEKIGGFDKVMSRVEESHPATGVLHALWTLGGRKREESVLP